MKIAHVLLHGYLLVLMVLCVNMGETKQHNTLQNAVYHKLEEKEGCYHATIYDDGNKIILRDFSFSGHTSIGGVFKESDDSVNTIEISETKEIVVISNYFESKRYPNQELLHAEIITKNNKKITDLLIPRHVVICGIEEGVNMQKAWFLSKVKKVVIDGPCGQTRHLEDDKIKAAVKVEAKETQDAAQVAIKKSVNVEIEAQKADKKESNPTVTGAAMTLWDSIVNLFHAVFGVFKAFLKSIARLLGFK